jgi:tRNA1(Val) A37 N6-methylase TrmN6
MKRVGPKRVRVVEVGAGHKPIGVIGQALRAQRKRQGREFVASDIKLNLSDTLRSFGLRNAPSNAKVLKECSIKTLKAQADKSADIIFGGFFFNGLMTSTKNQLEYLHKVNEFFQNAKRVLKPNGRIIFVAHHSEAFLIKEGVKNVGFSAHIIPFNERMIQNSSSEWVQKTTTQEGLMDFFATDHFRQNDSFTNKASAFSKLTKLSVEESARPALVIMRRLKQ